MKLVDDHVFTVLCSVKKKCKFCTVFARVMEHTRHSLFIIASCVFVILRSQILSNASEGYIKDYTDTKGKKVSA